MKPRRHEDRMYAALAHDSRRLDRARELNDARNASPLSERRVGGEPRDADEVPGRDEL